MSTKYESYCIGLVVFIVLNTVLGMWVSSYDIVMTYNNICAVVTMSATAGVAATIMDKLFR